MDVQERVTSPTYQLARGYEGRANGVPVQINHLDLYRLEGVEDRDVLELDDYVDRRTITFIEWAEPVLDLLEAPTLIKFAHATPTTRHVSITGPIPERLRSC